MANNYKYHCSVVTLASASASVHVHLNLCEAATGLDQMQTPQYNDIHFLRNSSFVIVFGSLLRGIILFCFWCAHIASGLATNVEKTNQNDYKEEYYSTFLHEFIFTSLPWNYQEYTREKWSNARKTMRKIIKRQDPDCTSCWWWLFWNAKKLSIRYCRTFRTATYITHGLGSTANWEPVVPHQCKDIKLELQHKINIENPARELA